MNTEKKIQTGIDFMTEGYPKGIEYKVEIHEVKDWKNKTVRLKKVVTVVFHDYENFPDCDTPKRINGKIKLPEIIQGNLFQQ